MGHLFALRRNSPVAPGFERWVQQHESGTFRPQEAEDWHLLTLGFAAIDEPDLAREQLDTLRRMDAQRAAHVQALLP